MLLISGLRLLFDMGILLVFGGVTTKNDVNNPFSILLHYLTIPFFLRTVPDFITIVTSTISSEEAEWFNWIKPANQSITAHGTINYDSSLTVRDRQFRKTMNAIFLAISFGGGFLVWCYTKKAHKTMSRPNIIHLKNRMFLVLIAATSFGVLLNQTDLIKMLHLDNTDYRFPFCFLFNCFCFLNLIMMLVGTKKAKSLYPPRTSFECVLFTQYQAIINFIMGLHLIFLCILLSQWWYPVTLAGKNFPDFPIDINTVISFFFLVNILLSPPYRYRHAIYKRFTQTTSMPELLAQLIEKEKNEARIRQMEAGPLPFKEDLEFRPTAPPAYSSA